MDEGQLVNQQYEYEIDLKEFIILFWKKKFFIAGLAVIGAALAAIVSLFFLKPVYNTELKFDVNLPKTYVTKFGEYTLPGSTNSQYLKLIISNDVIANTIKDMGYDENKVTIEDIRKRIQIGNIDSKSSVENVFDVKASADNAEESLRFAETLYSNYMEYIDIITRDRAIDYFRDSFEANLYSNKIALESTKTILKENEALLADTPETINQSSIANAGNGIVIENIINPAYTQLQSSVVNSKQSIIQIENNIENLNNHLNELEKEHNAIDEYYRTGVADDSVKSIINIADTSIYLLSDPVAPLHKTSPSNLKNTLIGLFLGGLLGVGIVFIKKYWQEAK